LEDKDRERAKIRNEYKTCILDLKQDKKRYEELLEIRDQELEKLEDKHQLCSEQEKKYLASLAKLNAELEGAKSIHRKEVARNESVSRSKER
jgi:hypothetical protein